MKTGKKTLSLLLALAMVLTLFPAFSGITALAASSGSTIDVGDSATLSGDGWTYAGGVFTVTGDVTITGTTTANKIVVQPGAAVIITLDGASINVSATPNACAFDMEGAIVNLTLVGTNTLKSGGYEAGIRVPSSASITIKGAGSLAATGGSWAAGIGGGYQETGGNITIYSGTVNAYGGDGAAGIGGGNQGNGGNIKITGGTVNAYGGGSTGFGAGIGGGNRGNGGNITISGGTVNANGGYGAAGIGGGLSHTGFLGAGGVIVISGGIVTAVGGGNGGSTPYYGGGAGIGGGGSYGGNTTAASGASGDITITSDATVSATGGNGTPYGSGGAGIGSGGAGHMYDPTPTGAVGKIIIEPGASVTAAGGTGSTGGGSNGANIGWGGGIVTPEAGTSITPLSRDYVCKISGGDSYETLTEAIDDAIDGDTIIILTDIADGEDISISDKYVTIDLDGYTVEIDSLIGVNGGIAVNGGGELSINGNVTVTGKAAVGIAASGAGTKVTAGSVTVTDAVTAHTAEPPSHAVGVLAEDGAAVEIGDLEITGNWSYAIVADDATVTADSVSVYGNFIMGMRAQDEAVVAIAGDITVTGSAPRGIIAESGADVTVGGDVITTGGFLQITNLYSWNIGVDADEASVTVAGNVVCNADGDFVLGIFAYDGDVTVGGLIINAAASAGGYDTYAVEAYGASVITIDGEFVYPDGAFYICMYDDVEDEDVFFEEGDGVISAGYYVYNTNDTYVKVKIPPSFAITYNNLNGASNSNPAAYTYGVGVLSLADPGTITGYTFTGWYDNAGLTGAPITSIPPTATGDKEFWAKWTENPTYGVSLNQSGTHTFTDASYGYAAQTPLAVTVTNTGNQATDALTIALSGTNPGAFTLSGTSISSIAVSGTENFTVVPNTGLGAGAYSATVTVSGDNDITTSFIVRFMVNKATGASVPAPTLASKTDESLTVNAVTAPANGQTVEYAINTGDDPPASGWQATLIFEGLTEYTAYYIFARSAANANYSAGTPSSAAFRTADVTQPTGTITVKTNGFTSFFNTITFGFFFKNTVAVTIAGADSGSGVKTVEYYLSAADLPDNTDWSTINWTAGTATSVTANWKGIVYARITDNEDNVTVIRSAGVVVYTDSEAVTTSISHTKFSGDKIAYMTLNGNTIAKINDGTRDLTRNTDYTVSSGTITFKEGYLDGLTASATPYILTISYNPQGESYVNGSENDTPATTSISLIVTVSAKTDMSSSIAFSPGTKTYTGSELDCAPATGLTGGTWTYTYTAVTGTLGTNNKPLTAGTYTATAKFEDATRIGTSAPQTFTVNKADQSAPSAPTMAIKTAVSVNLNTAAGYEYAYSTTNSAPATDWNTTGVFTGLSEYTQYYFFTRIAETDNYNTSPASDGAAIRTADETPPTATIEYNDNGFKQFLNTISFGPFFKKNVDVTIVGADTGSGVAEVAYYKAPASLGAATAANLAGVTWETVSGGTAAFSIEQNEKFILYVRVTDSDGNATYYSDGVVVYTDSEATVSGGSFSKDSTSDLTVSVAMNGNTVKAITNSGYTLVAGTDYTTGTNAIVFTNAYLKNLADGTASFIVSYYPGGETGTPQGDSEAPGTTTITVSISRATQTIAITGLGSTYTYGDAAFSLSVSGGSGSGAVTYVSGNPAVASISGNTVTIHKAGSFTITATKAADTVYNSASDTSGTVTVSEATPTVTLDGANVTYGADVTLTATVSKPAGSTGAVPTGTVTFYEDATPISSAIALSGGTASYTVTAPNAGNHSYSAVYSGQTDYYTTATGTKSVGVGLSDQAALTITGKPTTITYGDSGFTLNTSGGSGTGTISFSVPNNDIISITNSGAVTINNAGTVIVTATKAGDSNYNAATATLEVTVLQRDISNVCYARKSGLRFFLRKGWVCGFVSSCALILSLLACVFCCAPLTRVQYGVRGALWLCS